MTPVSVTAAQFSVGFDGVRSQLEMASDAGFAGIFFFDHLIPLGDPNRPVLELAGVIGAAAASADVRVGSLVMRAPLRGTAISSLIAATVQRISEGRFVLGVGAGDSMSAEEARRFGMPADSLSDRVEAVRATAVAARSAGVPVWIGGTHTRILEAVLETADGWNGWGLDTGKLNEVAGRLRSERDDLTLTWGGAVLVGKDDDDVDALLRKRGDRSGVIAGTPATVASELRDLAAAGADELIVSILPNRRDRWELFAGSVLPHIASR